MKQEQGTEERQRTLSDILREDLAPVDDLSLEAHPEDKARAALLRRPRFSVRARLILLFLAMSLLSFAVSTAGGMMISQLERSVRLVTTTNVFTNEIHQARRYEKNYFLYKSDLREVHQHIDAADALLQQAAAELGGVVGADEILALQGHLREYRKLVNVLIAREGEQFRDSDEFHKLEAALRDHGSKMIAIAIDITNKERVQIFKLTALTRKMPLIVLAIFVPLAILIGIELSRHIIRRLDRLVQATQRIANGDFSPIRPKRKYRDEFSNLAIAINHMMYELARRHRILVESHKMRAVGNLTAGIAHELNNPLNNILLTSEMLKEDYENMGDEERLGMVDDLIAQAIRSRSIVKNLLDFVRESETTVEHIHVTTLIDETTRLAGNQIRINKIKLHKDIDPLLSPIYGDKGLLQQAFLNLFLNAIDAMPKGGHLFIRASEGEGTGFLAIHITDTGTGIPNHLLRSIFDPFFTTKPTGKGTGLGLAVSRGIVNNHGGEIETMSKVGVGTTFTVHLPCVPVPAELETASDEAGRIDPADTGKAEAES